MKKSEIELDSSIEIILIVIGLILVLILVSAIILNTKSIGTYLKGLMGDLF